MSEYAVGKFVKQVNTLNRALGDSYEPGASYQLRQCALETYTKMHEAEELAASSVIAVVEDLMAVRVNIADIVRSPLALSIPVSRERGIFFLDLFDSVVELEAAE